MQLNIFLKLWGKLKFRENELRNLDKSNYP